MSVENIPFIRTSNLKQKELAIMFNRDQSTISNIRAGKRWGDVK